MRFIFLLSVLHTALALVFGGFDLKSQLTTYSNTLLDNTIYVLPSQDSSTSPAPTSFSSTSDQAPVATTPTLSSAPRNSPGSSTSFTSQLPYVSLTPEVSRTASIPTEPTEAPTHPSVQPSSSSGLATDAVSHSVAAECSNFYVTEVVFATHTSIEHRSITLSEVSTSTVVFYANKTQSVTPLAPLTTIHSTSTGTTTSTITRTSACGCVEIATQTQVEVQTVWAVKTVDGLLVPPLESANIEAYETTVNGSALLYLSAVQATPAWPFEFNDFPETSPGSLQTAYPPPREVVPPQLTSQFAGGVTDPSASPSRVAEQPHATHSLSALPIYALPAVLIETGLASSETTENDLGILTENEKDFFSLPPITLPPVVLSSAALTLGSLVTQSLPELTILPGLTIFPTATSTGDVHPTATPALTLVPTSLTATSTSSLAPSLPTVPFSTLEISLPGFGSVLSGIPTPTLSTLEISLPGFGSVLSGIPTPTLSTLEISLPGFGSVLSGIPTPTLEISLPGFSSLLSGIPTVTLPTSDISTPGVSLLPSSSLVTSVPTIPTLIATSTNENTAASDRSQFSAHSSVTGNPASFSTAAESFSSVLTPPVTAHSSTISTATGTSSIGSSSLPDGSSQPTTAVPTTAGSGSGTGYTVAPMSSAAINTGTTIGSTSASSSSVSSASFVSSVASASSFASASSASSAQETFDYDCGPLNSNSDDVLVCKKNAQIKVEPPSLNTQIAVYFFVVLILLI